MNLSNRQMLYHGSHGPCEWEPAEGRESYLSDPYHGIGWRIATAPGGRFKGEKVRVCPGCLKLLARA